MRLLFAFLLLFAFCRPSHAEVNGHEVLFAPKTEWINTARPLTAADAKGRVVLLDFWTYGCINCMHIVPDLKKLEAEFGDRLLVIGVHSAKFQGEKGTARILAAAQRFGVTHPVINDANFDVWEAFDVQAWPTLILLDGEGKAFNTYRGEGHYAELQRDIKDKLASMAAVAPLAGVKAENKNKNILSFPARLGFAKGTPWGDLLFVADSGHNRLLGATLKGDIKITIGSGQEGAANGDFAKASFHTPRGFAATKEGVYIADTENHLIRYADFKTRTVSTVAGTGTQGHEYSAHNDDALETDLSSPWDAKLLPDGKTLAIAMAGTHQLWTLDTENKKLSVLAGTGKEFIDDGEASSSSLSQPSGLAVSNEALYFVDAETSSLRVLKGGEVTTLIGTGLFDFGHVDGAYPKARMQHAQGLAIDGTYIAIADTYNNALRVYDTGTATLKTVGVPKDTLAEPGDVLALDGVYYVADTNNHRIVTVEPKTGKTAPLPLSQPKP